MFLAYVLTSDWSSAFRLGHQLSSSQPAGDLQLPDLRASVALSLDVPTSPLLIRNEQEGRNVSGISWCFSDVSRGRGWQLHDHANISRLPQIRATGLVHNRITSGVLTHLNPKVRALPEDRRNCGRVCPLGTLYTAGQKKTVLENTATSETLGQQLS